jgi:hypothetical protein
MGTVIVNSKKDGLKVVGCLKKEGLTVLTGLLNVTYSPTRSHYCADVRPFGCSVSRLTRCGRP